MGNVDLLTDFTSSGFSVLHQAEYGCRVNFTVRNNDFYQHKYFSCSYNYWYKMSVGYHQALGGYYRFRHLRERSYRWGESIGNLFSMTRVNVPTPYTFTGTSSLFLGNNFYSFLFNNLINFSLVDHSLFSYNN